MYVILDPNLQVSGILDLEGNQGCKFYDDLRTVQIADDQGKVWSDTLQLSVPYGYPQTDMMTEGYHLLKQADDGLFYCYRIYNWTDDVIGGVHVKKVQAYNLCIWELYHKILPAKTFTNVKSDDAFDYVLQQSGWAINNNEFSGALNSFEVSQGQTAQSALDSLITALSVEVRAYVELSNGQIVRKLIDIVQELGESEGRRLEYSHDLEGLSRSGDDTQMYTKLHVYGGTDSNGNVISINTVNDGRTYIVDDDANDTYNYGKTYLEGYVINESITNPTALLDWGKKQLDLYNHPRYTYNVDIAHLGYKPNLGDHIQVVDFSMQPELTISARVIQIDESEANPLNNKYTLGEFIEITAVTPDVIWKLQAKASQAYQEAQKAKAYKVEYFCPDGTDFADNTEKRIIIRVYQGTDEVTAQIDSSKFVWQKINSDGSHDTDWEDSHVGIGNVITVGSEVVGSTIRCQVDDGLSDSILFAAEEDAAYFATLQMDPPSGWDDFTNSVAQYAQVDYPRSDIYWSQRYYGDKRHSGDGSADIQSYVLTRTDLTGAIKDRMWVIRGGHGAQFGIEYINGKMWIWSYYLDVANNQWHVVKFPYQANKVLDWGDSSIVNMLSTNGGYRTNLDVRNGYVLFVYGTTNPTFYVCNKADVEAKKFKPLYTARGSDVNYFGTDQTYQSACLDFPYVYFTSGNGDSSDQRCLYCFDIRSKSLVYRIVYTFDKGTINQIGQYNEPEAISYYYDSDGKKWLIQGFAWGNEDSEDSQRTNQLFRINEHKRGETS